MKGLRDETGSLGFYIRLYIISGLNPPLPPFPSPPMLPIYPSSSAIYFIWADSIFDTVKIFVVFVKVG
jgi:hypothetical protein